MLGRIIEISDNQRYLSVYRGFMVISHQGEEIARVALDMITAVITHGYGTTHSSNLLSALAERGIPFVICGKNHLPTGMLLSTSGNFHQGKRIQAQIEASKPLRKNLWKQIIQSKISMQAWALDVTNTPSNYLTELAKKVASGDPDNKEGQAAHYYWQQLYGKDFRRNRDDEGINALLNYGYTIFRSATARSVIAAGLHPSAGLHHKNAYNPMHLVDDLIEPFRPIVDLRVLALCQLGIDSITPASKKALAKLLYIDWITKRKTSVISHQIQALATSLSQVYLQEKRILTLPERPKGKTLRLIYDISANHEK